MSDESIHFFVLHFGLTALVKALAQVETNRHNAVLVSLLAIMVNKKGQKRQAIAGETAGESLFKSSKKQTGHCQCKACGESSKDFGRRVGFAVGGQKSFANSFEDLVECKESIGKEHERWSTCFALRSLKASVTAFVEILLALEDKSWALRRTIARTGTEVPEGDACEDCYTSWNTYFPHLCWQEFAAKMQDGEDPLHAHLASAKKVAAQPSLKQWPKQTVSAEKKTMLEVKRAYIGLTLGELKKKLNMKRISKAALDALPSIDTLDVSGNPDKLYLFLDPNKPYKRVNIKSVSLQDWSTQSMAPDGQSWQQQGEEVWKHSSQKALASAGVFTLLNKEIMHSLDDYVNEKIAEKRDGSALPGDQAEEGEEGDDEAGELVGAAAVQAALWQQQQQSQQTLRKSLSSRNLGGQVKTKIPRDGTPSATSKGD
eukprot:6479738-Amphidinium_carterae.1